MAQSLSRLSCRLFCTYGRHCCLCNTKIKKIAICFEEQIVKKISLPITNNDIKMDIIVTDRRIIKRVQNSVIFIKILNEQKKQAAEKEAKIVEMCEKIKQKIEMIKIKIPVKTGEGDRVFGSVSTKTILNELKNKGIEVDKKKIKLEAPLSSLGFHNVEIELHKNVKAVLKIELVRM